MASSSSDGRPGDRAAAERRPAFPRRRALLLVLLAALAAGAGLYPLTVLQIEDRRQERVLFLGALDPGGRLCLRYRHSVELSPVWDHFVVDRERRLVLTETVFTSSNTGLPALLGEGERLDRRGEAFRIVGMHRILPALEIWVERRYGNTLILGEREIPLAALAGDTLLRIQVRDVAAARWAWGQTLFLLNRLSRRADERPSGGTP